MKYLRFGDSKKFIVFLHGWGADKNSFLWLKSFFSDFSLVFVDFPGFGESPEPEREYYLSDYVFELKKVLDSFDIESLTLVGHSFGGRVAIKYSFLYQDNYREFKLCLVDSAGIKPRKSLLYKIRVSRYKRLKKRAEKLGIEDYRLNKFGSSDYKKLSDVMKKTFVHIVNEDLSDMAKKIKVKTMIVWGKKDKETKLYMARKLHKYIKDSQLYIFKSAEHFSFLDNRLDFLILLDTFVKN